METEPLEPADEKILTNVWPWIVDMEPNLHQRKKKHPISENALVSPFAHSRITEFASMWRIFTINTYTAYNWCAGANVLTTHTGCFLGEGSNAQMDNPKFDFLYHSCLGLASCWAAILA